MTPFRTALAAVRRWLRHSWLARVPLMDRLLTPRPSPSRPPQRPRIQPQLEELEKIWLPNDPFGIVQGAMIGGPLLDQFGRFATPSQVIWHGWASTASSSRAPGLMREPSESRSGWTAPGWDRSDVFFTSLRVDRGRLPQVSEEQTSETEPSRTRRQTEEDANHPLGDRAFHDSLRTALSDLQGLASLEDGLD